MANNNATKKHIKDTAYKLFIEKGYSNVTVNDICSACGITKTTFYYHLNSKEDIVLDYYGNLTKNIIKQITVILSEESPYNQFLKIFDILLKESIKYGPDFISQMFISNLKEDYGSFNMNDELTNLAVLLISKAQENGEVKNKNTPLDLYVTAAYAFTGLEVTWCIKNGDFDWETELKKRLNTIFNVD